MLTMLMFFFVLVVVDAALSVDGDVGDGDVGDDGNDDCDDDDGDHDDDNIII